MALFTRLSGLQRSTGGGKYVLLGMAILTLLSIAATMGMLGPRRFRHAAQEQDIEYRAMRAAGNRTLGFDSIRFINMPYRYDRLDAASLQAYLAGIDIEEYPAVGPGQINEVGMPPTRNPTLKPGEKGCWRAHANIWSEMLRKKLPPVLILESDASWDVNLRPIMALFNRHFTRFLQKMRSRPLYSANSTVQPAHTMASSGSSWRISADELQNEEQQLKWQQLEELQEPMLSTGQPDLTVEFNIDDPWHSEHWDLLSIGQCFDQQKDDKTYLRYSDPFSPSGKDYFGQRLGRERVVHRSGGIVCTTAYAITQRGAAKLLVRTALNLDQPVDLVMQSMIANNELVAYSMIPTIMAQWHYVANLGMEYRGANSDIQGTNAEFVDPSKQPRPEDMTGWDEVERTKSVWTLKAHHPDAAFRDMALQVAWKRIFSKEGNIEGGLE